MFTKPTATEKIANSLVTESALTVIAAITGGPLAPLLPILTKSLAAERQKKRVESALEDISYTLKKHEHQLAKLSDEQYKLINEAVLATLQTTENKKLKILRNVVHNSFQLVDILPMEAIILSRIIRDISAEEVEFLFEAFKYADIEIVNIDVQSGSNDANLLIKRNTKNELLAAGLLSLGVLTQSEFPTGLTFTSLAATLITLLSARRAD